MANTGKIRGTVGSREEKGREERKDKKHIDGKTEKI
jgi:hypothetical protein